MGALHTPIRIEQLLDIAYRAGQIMKKHFKPFGKIERVVKADTTPVTAADHEINRLVIEKIRQHSSAVDILGEEESHRTKSPWQIVCDPIDGTFPFTWGIPLSTFMIGLLYEGTPVMGVIYDPFTGRMYHAEKGMGAWMNHTFPLRVSNVSKPKERPIVGYVSWPGCPYNILKVCQWLEEGAGATLVGFATVGYIDAAVASGEFVATIFPGKHYLDTAPGHIIVEEAGGKVTDVFGRPLSYTSGEIAGHIFSNGVYHDLMVEAVHACA